MIEAQLRRRQAADLQFVGDVAGAEDARGEGDERVEDDEDDVEIVDQNDRSPSPAFETNSDSAASERQERRGSDIEPRRQPIARASRRGWPRSPRGMARISATPSSANAFIAAAPEIGRARATSTVSNRSRMRNRNTPITMNATSTEKATRYLHHQRHALGARGGEDQAVLQRHEADDLLTALRRITIISRPSSTTESAKARSSRASASASAVDAQHHDHRQRDQRQAGQHGGADADRHSRPRDGCRAGR